MGDKLTQALIIIATIVVLADTARAFKFQDCTSGAQPDAKLGEIQIDSCPDARGSNCLLNRGTNASIKIDFEATKTFSQAQVSIKAKLGLVYIPFVLKPSEACGNYGFNCPVQPGQKVQLNISLPVLRVYPQLSPFVKLELLDEEKNPIICVGFPAKIK